MDAHYIRDELARGGHFSCHIPGWTSEQMWLRSGRRTFTLALSIVAFVAVAAAGPDVMFPEPVTAETLRRWPWLIVWSTIAGWVVWELFAAALCRRWRRASRELRFESLSRAVDFAQDTLALSGQRHGHSFWHVQAVIPLAALVYTASTTHGNGQGMPWVRQMVADLAEDGAAGWEALATAVADADRRLPARVGRWADSDPRQRDSVALVLQEAVGAAAGVRA